MEFSQSVAVRIPFQFREGVIIVEPFKISVLAAEGYGWVYHLNAEGFFEELFTIFFELESIDRSNKVAELAVTDFFAEFSESGLSEGFGVFHIASNGLPVTA
jgi:hypothetical protein